MANVGRDTKRTTDTTLEIIAFHLGNQQFCIKTMSIRGWAAATPLPHAPLHVLGVMNLRGSIIPVIDLAAKLAVPSAVDTNRSAIVVVEVGQGIVGLVVDQVSDILSISGNHIQPVPDLGTSFDPGFCYGIISLEHGWSASLTSITCSRALRIGLKQLSSLPRRLRMELYSPSNENLAND